MSRKQIYDKYFNSNIFNNDPALASQVPKVRTRISQTSLTKTKDDLFNTEQNIPKEEATKKGVKRYDVYSKLYGSDIFCRTAPNEVKKKSGVKKIRNANNFSSCFDSMKNIEEYKTNLKKYTKERRTEKKSFKPDKYFKNETPAERYYKEMYDPYGVNVLPDRCFSADRYDKEKYAQRKKNWKNETNQLNDEISDMKLNPKENKKIYVRVKNKWMDDNSGNYHYIDSSKINPVNKCKINKQIYLQSNLFKNEDNKDINSNDIKTRTKTLDNINNRIEEEKNRANHNKNYHISLHEKKRDLTGNDRMLYGAVHSKWEKSKIDWLNPQTELMFGTQAIKDLKSEFGPKGPNDFQRKLNQLADTKNIDTINETDKGPLNKIERPIPQNEINDKGIERLGEILEEMPNLKQDKKFKIKMETITSGFNNDKDWEKKAKTLTNFYSSPSKENLNKKNKKEITGKIGNKKGTNNKKELEEKCGHDFTDYVLTYATKGNFEKFGENDIKNMFEKNGVHIYDIKKNMFDKGTYNMIKFKVRNDEKGEENLNQKINEIEKNLGKNYKVKINKEKKKNLKINSKNFVSNPGAKLGILNENIGVHDNAKFTKLPEKIRSKKNFSKQYEQINYKYKHIK